jgi:hypothetical protein
MKSLIFLVLFSGALLGCSAGSDAPPSNTDPGFKLVFALIETGQIFRSTDTGLTWQPILFPSAAPVKCLASQGNDLFAATDSGVFQSTNNGESWHNNNAGFFGKTTCLVSNQNALYEGTYDGLYRSSDNGHYWETLESGTMITNLAPFQNRFFASIRNDAGILVSPEGGGPNWNYVKFFSGSVPYKFISTDNFFYARPDWSPPYRTSDYGVHWEQVERVDYATGPMRFYSSSQDGSQSVVSVDNGLHLLQMPTPPGTIMCLDHDFTVACTSNGDSVLRSVNRGAIWQLIHVPWDPQNAVRTILTK